MTELAERARQIEKGKSKNKSKNAFTGLGGSVFTRLAEFFPQAPPKISLFSPFERVNDRRTLSERRDLFMGQTLIKENREAKPKSKFDNPSAPQKKLKSKKKDVNGDEPAAESEHKEEAHQEEEQHNEEEQPPAEE